MNETAFISVNDMTYLSHLRYYGEALEKHGIQCLYLITELKFGDKLDELNEIPVDKYFIPDRLEKYPGRLRGLVRKLTYFYHARKVKKKYRPAYLIHASARPIGFLSVVKTVIPNIRSIFIQVPVFSFQDFSVRNRRSVLGFKSYNDHPFSQSHLYDILVFKSQVFQAEFEEFFADRGMNTTNYFLPSPLSLLGQSMSIEEFKEKPLSEMGFIFLVTLLKKSGTEELPDYVQSVQGHVNQVLKHTKKVALKLHPKSDVSSAFIEEHFPGIPVFADKDIQKTMQAIEQYEFVVGNYSTLMRDSIGAGKFVLGWHGFTRFAQFAQDEWEDLLGEFYFKSAEDFEGFLLGLSVEKGRVEFMQKYLKLAVCKKVRKESGNMDLDEFQQTFFDIVSKN